LVGVRWKGWREGRPQHNAFTGLNHKEWEVGDLNNRGRQSRRTFVLPSCVAAPLRITSADSVSETMVWAVSDAGISSITGIPEEVQREPWN
jgi:hypothetical protein